MTATDYVGRFEGRADIYARNRPSYPQQVILTLRNEIGFVPGKVVADIGSGTGILSELFLENGNRVYCVEPNMEMRHVAEKRLARYSPRFISVNGRAEGTTLKDQSIDLVTAGQALHWFSIENARREFARVLRSDGYIAVIYNHRKKEGQVEKAYSEVVDRYAKNRAAVPDVDDAYVARFLMNNDFRKFVIPNSQVLDMEGMLGRMASASYMPKSGSEDWNRLKEDVEEIIRICGSNGMVTLHYDTVLHLGRIF